MSQIVRRIGSGTKILFVDPSRPHICNLLIVAGLYFSKIRSASEFLQHNIVSEVDVMQRIEHYLENIPSGGDWKEFCATTPVSFRGMNFTGAHICFEEVCHLVTLTWHDLLIIFQNHATWGHWVFYDESCK
jgi:hypothetical protein